MMPAPDVERAIPAANADWEAANQAYLRAALDLLRAHVEGLVPAERKTLAVADAEQALEAATRALPQPAALQTLCASFGLTAFERDLLLLSAGLELDAAFGPLYAAAQGDPSRSYPTFSLALEALPGAYWAALTPDAALRRWRMLEVAPGPALMFGPLRIDERVLHHLLGVSYLDDRLAGIVEVAAEAEPLSPSQIQIVDRIASAWSRPSRDELLPRVQLCGPDAAGMRSVAITACRRLGLQTHVVNAHALPADPREVQALVRLLEREAALARAGLILACDELDPGDAARWQAVARLVGTLNGVLVVTARQRGPLHGRHLLVFDVAKPTAAEQRSLWSAALGPAAADLNGSVDALAAQFNLSAEAIRDSVASVAAGQDGRLGDRLWQACLLQARPRLDDLAQRITTRAGWDDLVLPELQLQTLHDIAVQVRQRDRVYEAWGFAAKSSRGLGISALFAGASGTGKTLAAEVLANELHLDLYRIDLSQVVSKYIGETEKNLRRVFDAAEDGGVVLLFDEADALFGKRSEVKDSHDRYANIEVSYLLQRMEAYRGLAILTTNMKGALDSAFLRRIRFVVNFPFPDVAERAEIWRRVFPDATPVAGLNVLRLAQLNMAGGNIRNIALQAAFQAAEAGQPVSMDHLLHAVRAEYAKLEKPLPAHEVADWV